MNGKPSGPVRTGFKIGGWGILAIIGAFLVFVLIASMNIFGWGFFQRSTADFRGETGQIEKVQADPNYRIAHYDMFFDKCASVKTSESTIRNQQKEMDAGVSEARKAQLQTNITAARNIRAEKINQYNADAMKDETAANFLASNLPYQLNEQDEVTTCTL